ncbi:MAG: hypothetical protein JXA30_04790 [Deltaproteobacteria bacterium]|nr:hypothetical protein [Deltaproteobacteria bacterium]
MSIFYNPAVIINSEVPNNCRKVVNCLENPAGCKGTKVNTQCLELPADRVLLEFDPNSDEEFQGEIYCTELHSGGDWEIVYTFVPRVIGTKDLIIKPEYFSLEYVGIRDLPDGPIVDVAKLTFKAATFNSDTQIVRRCNLSWAIRKNKEIKSMIRVGGEVNRSESITLQFPGAC